MAAEKSARKPGYKDTPTWMGHEKDIILLANNSGKNFILELPAGRYRLDAGRRIRTLRSILDIADVKRLVDAGELVVEKG